MNEIGSSIQPLIVAQSLSLRFPQPTTSLPAPILPESIGLGPIDLVLPGNQLVALLGAAGAGKSLLFQVLTGEIPADFGQLRVLDSQVSFPIQSQVDFQPLARPDQLVYLPAEAPRPAKETLTELIDSSVSATHQPWKPWRDQIIEQLGIATWLDLPLARLSAGQWQICRWAWALLMKPRIILADHPTCFLPKTQSVALIDFLKNYIACTQALIVCATNDPNLAQRADQLLFMVDGQLTDSTPDTARPIRHFIALPDEETLENQDGSETDLSSIYPPATPPPTEQPADRAIPATVDQANWEDSWPTLAAALLPGAGGQKEQFNPDSLGNLGILAPGASVVPAHLQTPQGAREYLRSHHSPDLPAVPAHLEQRHSPDEPAHSPVSATADNREIDPKEPFVTGQNYQPIAETTPNAPEKESVLGAEAQTIRKYPPRRSRLQR